MGAVATVFGSQVTLVGDAFTPIVAKTLNAAASVTLADGGLVQRNNTVIVHFNDDNLDLASAQNPQFYRLHNTAGTLTPDDDTLQQPIAVVYDSVSNTSVLTFSADLPIATYALKVGSNSELTDTLADAIVLGELSAAVQWSGIIGDNNAGANDVDLYKFTLITSQTVSFTAMPVLGLNVALRLFDSAGIEQGGQNSGIAGVAETLSLPLTLGTYYLGVSSARIQPTIRLMAVGLPEEQRRSLFADFRFGDNFRQ